MKAMIFAAGLGTRLRPLTDEKPKALVEVGGRPMLGRVIDKLAHAGVKSMVVNVHHFAPMVKRYLADHYGNSGLNIAVSDESDLLLDTGGGIAKAHDMLAGNEPILVHNADILTDFDLKAMEEAFDKSEADAMLLVADRDSGRKLLFDDDMRMRGWHNFKSGEYRPADVEGCRLAERAFGGVHLLKPTMLDALVQYGLKQGPVFSITPFYIDMCSEYNICGYEPHEAYMWHDIGSVEKLKAANLRFNFQK